LQPEARIPSKQLVYLPWQQSIVQPSLQQSLHLSVQQDAQHAFFTEEVWASAETARTTATERTANIRFMEILLDIGNTWMRDAGDNGRRLIWQWERQGGLNPEHAQKDVSRRGVRRDDGQNLRTAVPFRCGGNCQLRHRWHCRQKRRFYRNSVHHWSERPGSVAAILRAVHSGEGVRHRAVGVHPGCAHGARSHSGIAQHATNSGRSWTCAKQDNQQDSDDLERPFHCF
jgi:hypothetical protein